MNTLPDHSPAPASSGKWMRVVTGEHNGKFNMEFDLQLVEEFRNNRVPVLRFYRWSPYCISLGRNQNAADIDENLAAKDGVEVVRRPTGGKAVLHSEELTYSVVTGTEGMSVRESYNKISAALAIGLRTLGADLELARSSADFRRLFHDPSAITCFSTSAVYEVESNGRKLVGSAQHRFGDILLQHGSILTGSYHKQIVKYLMIDEEAKQKTLNDLDVHTVTLSDLLQRPVDIEEIEHAVQSGFEETFAASFEPVPSDTLFVVPSRN